MLEVRIHGLELRVPYGVNNSGPTSGVLPGLLSAPAPKIIKLDTKRNVALFVIRMPCRPTGRSTALLSRPH
jgi:acetamidase/formamidase